MCIDIANTLRWKNNWFTTPIIGSRKTVGIRWGSGRDIFVIRSQCGCNTVGIQSGSDRDPVAKPYQILQRISTKYFALQVKKSSKYLL